MVRNQKKIIGVTRNLVIVHRAYNYLIQLIPLLIVAPLYFRGQVEFGVVTQAAMAFAQVLGALSLIITQFETLSAFAAVSERLNVLIEAIDRAQRRPKGAIRVDAKGDRIVFEGVTLRDPRDEAVAFVRDLSLDLRPGDRLLVTGPNPQGKRALFLAIAGLWSDGDGRIVRPARACFLARHPLLVPGDLREQLAVGGPEGDPPPEEAAALAALEAVGFGPALERVGGLGAEHDWPNALTPGEQQLLAFARLLLSRPAYAILDHITDALRPDEVGPLLGKLKAVAIAYVCFAEDHELLDRPRRRRSSWPRTAATGSSPPTAPSPPRRSAPTTAEAGQESGPRGRGPARQKKSATGRIWSPGTGGLSLISSRNGSRHPTRSWGA